MKIKGVTYLTILLFLLSAGMTSAKTVSVSPRDGFSYKITASVKVVPNDMVCENVNELSKMTSVVKILKNHISLEVEDSYSPASPNFVFSYALQSGENARRTSVRFISRLKN